MNVADYLEAAADYIDKRGWSQGALVGVNGTVCAQGAISMAVNDNDCKGLRDYYETSAILSQYLRDITGDRRLSIVRWNDSRTTDPLQVTSAMRAAAALWRSEHVTTDAIVDTTSPVNSSLITEMA